MLSMCWVLLCVSVASARAKLVEFPEFGYLETNNAVQSGQEHDLSRGSSAAQPRVFAVDLPLQSASAPLRLRAASDEETEQFEETVQPIVLLWERRRRMGAGTPRDRPRAVTSRGGAESPADDRRVVQQIRSIVNKFVLSGAGDREQALADALADHTSPPLTVYVRGRHAALVVRAESHTHRLVLRPPSPLPFWLHAATAAGLAGDVPSRVQSQLYRTLLRLVKVFLRFDL